MRTTGKKLEVGVYAVHFAIEDSFRRAIRPWWRLHRVRRILLLRFVQYASPKIVTLVFGDDSSTPRYI